MRHQLKEVGLEQDVACDSAGTLNYHTDNAPDDRMTATLESRGVEVTGQARQISDNDLEEFDLVLTMDDDNYKNVMNLCGANRFGHKVHKFVEFCQNHEAHEVPDPYYGGQQGFDHVADLLEDGCSHIISEIQAGRLKGE